MRKGKPQKNDSLIKQIIAFISVDYIGNDLSEGHYDVTPTAAECQRACQRTSGCEFWTWDP